MKKVLSRWYLLVIGGLLLAAMAVFLLCGEDSVIAVHDNLDLFIPQLQMMRNGHSFFSHDAYVDFLGGISRDTLFSEFYIYTILFMLLPAFPAYIAAYFLKILIAIAGSVLLGRELLGEKYKSQQALVWLCGFAYGILRGVHCGLLEEKWLGTAERALKPVLSLISEEGILGQVSYGTPMGRENRDFYKEIPLKPMPYGQALAILFLVEWKKLRADDEVTE